MSRFQFAPDHVKTPAQAHEAAVAARAWRARVWGRPPELPAPPRLVHKQTAAVSAAPAVEFGRTRVCDVIKAACLCFGISRDELLSHDRHARFTTARHAAMVVARRLTGESYPQLGRFFGGRDHSTILSACRKRHDKTLRAAIAELMAALEASATAPADEGEADGGA
jgi:chromosomal replication initiator protein